MRVAIALALLVGGVTSASAQTAEPPDPASISLPSLGTGNDPQVIENGWKHFYFHKDGVSYAEAYADFADCYRFLLVPYVDARLPTFSPWPEKPGVTTFRPVNNYGLVGGVIGAMVEGPLIRRAMQSRLRRCLEPRGYLRYPISEYAWEQLTDNFSAQSIAVQAKAASGPRPDQEPVTQ
jgi:hypothetical protein